MKILDYISLKVSPYKTYIIILLIITVFICVSMYAAYRYYGAKDAAVTAKFGDVANASETVGEVDLMMFHVEWCPHCVKALPEWKSFCDTYNGTNINGYKINCDSNGNDCTDDADPLIKGLLKQYKINSFPTIILIKNGQVYNYDATVTKNSLEQFVETVTTTT